jgi:hypothetical protein
MPRAARKILFGWSLILLAAAAVAQPAPSAAGHWEGAIQAADQQFALTVDLAQNSAGAWIGSISIPIANVADLPVAGISIRDGAVRFTIPDFPGNPALEAKFSEDGNELAGTVANPNGPVPFKLRRKGQASVKTPTLSTAMSADFEGTWSGAFDAGGKALRVIVILSRAADGMGTGSMISLDQGAQEIPMSTVTIRGKQLQFEIRALGGLYRGTLGGNGEIAGQYSQGPATLPLNLKRSDPK